MYLTSKVPNHSTEVVCRRTLEIQFQSQTCLQFQNILEILAKGLLKQMLTTTFQKPIRKWIETHMVSTKKMKN